MRIIKSVIYYVLFYAEFMFAFWSRRHPQRYKTQAGVCIELVKGTG